MPIDPLSLRAMQAGLDVPSAAWEELLLAPDGGDHWRDAGRSRSTDALIARLVRKRAWLARAWLATLRSANVDLQVPRLVRVGPAVLGDVELELSWGDTMLRATLQGDHVTLRLPEGAETWFRSDVHGEGRLTGGWRFESTDAPVLLVALVGGSGEDLDARLASATAIASVVLTAEA